MKFELKDYQDEAASRILSGLRKGSAEYLSDKERAAVSLSAPTGAGKTVIAAAVLERLLFGDADGDHGANPDAVVLWLTDDPSLNEQTRKKILEASDRIQPAHLATLDDSFDQPELSKGRVYFLNIHKLGKNSNLVIKKEGRRVNSLWDTIRNSVESNGENYYLVIDEAHRGTGTKSTENQTIAQRLMHGDDRVPAAPVVLGISATPERFEAAVKAASEERVLRKVTVPTAAVRESGLIKDVLSISYRAEDQMMEMTLVRQAVADLRTISAAWNSYTQAEGEPPVRPAMVLQIPPSASPTDVGALLDVCAEEWDELSAPSAIAHSLESHAAAEFGSHVVNYVQPQDIQDLTDIRLVLFKEALTTGWDCPRAEVMVSLRTARDGTYIAQLIGRMVRSPLARRVQSEETLNRVRLYLPQFDHATVQSVKDKLENDEGGIATDIEINSVDAARNEAVPRDAFAAVEGLPSYVVPAPIHRSQIARLHKLAALLVGDQLLSDAIKAADQFLVSILDTERARLAVDGVLEGMITDIETAVVEVLDVKGAESATTSTIVFDTDVADLNRMFVASRRRLRDGLSEKYWAHRVSNLDEDSYDAKVLTVALASDTATSDKVEEEASDRVRQWLDTYGDSIAMLSEDKKAKYAEVRAMAREPELVRPGLPSGPISMPGDVSVDSYRLHLYSNEDGEYRTRLGTWERHALEVESKRSEFVGWYRNPTGGQRSVCVPYVTGGGYAKLFPDLVVVHKYSDGTLRPSIVDPHGQHFADAADKLRGLSSYAERHGSEVARVLAVIRNGAGDYRMLDLKDATVRAQLNAVNGRDEIEELFAKFGSVYA